MMAGLIRAGERIARAAETRRVRLLAGAMRDLVGDAAVKVEGNRVILSSDGVRRRWLGNSGMRFAGRDGQ